MGERGSVGNRGVGEWGSRDNGGVRASRSGVRERSEEMSRVRRRGS